MYTSISYYNFEDLFYDYTSIQLMRNTESSVTPFSILELDWKLHECHYLHTNVSKVAVR